MSNATKSALSPGQQISYTVPGTSATVTVHRTDNGHNNPTYLVFAAQGSYRPDGWTFTYADEFTARFEATRAAVLFKRHRNADQIENRRHHLTATVAEQERRQRRNMHDPALLASARDELDSLLTLADMAALVSLRADIDRLAEIWTGTGAAA